MDRAEAIIYLEVLVQENKNFGRACWGNVGERCLEMAIAALREQDTLKRLVMGEWVDCEAVQNALGIDFATGMKMFDFSRTAEWNPAPLNGQKITTKFRLKLGGAEE